MHINYVYKTSYTWDARFCSWIGLLFRFSLLVGVLISDYLFTKKALCFIWDGHGN
jgi:hypothetical protein